MVPLYEEPENLIKTNFQSQLSSDYPKDLIGIYPVVEQKDKGTTKIVKDLSKEMEEVTPIVVPDNGKEDWPNVLEEWSKNRDVEYDGNMDLPFGKGRALTYAYYSDTSDLKNAEVLTVFDAEDIIDPELFKYAISGLEQGFDVVQGKLRYRNKDKNILTSFESVDPVVWSNMIYNHTSNEKVPYQVLGPAYFFDVNLPGEIGGWSPYTTSEDVDFGFKAWNKGKKLGILDVYVDELGVETLHSWFKQRRRWARGHQKHAFDKHTKGKNFFETARNKFNYYSYSINSQLMAVTSVVGVPTGLYKMGELVMQGPQELGPVFTGITLFNLANWAYGSYKIIKDTNSAYEFDSKKDKMEYYLKVNPFTCLFYSMIWAAPTAAAIKDNISAKRGKKIEWEKTPREGYEDKEEGKIILEEVTKEH
jgi:cellulose synthase/poly-beta-1,6-N-acetylglucosamine synthase-like glycosyltransferase